MATYSGQTLINVALTNLGILEQGGVPSVSDSNEALTRLNYMFGQWRIQNKLVWSAPVASYALTANQAAYPIGLTATAPFNVARPTYIQQALIGLAGPNPANIITYPVKIITQQEYGEIADTNAKGAIPEKLYNDRGSPNSILYLWPVPRAATATTLILYTLAQLTSLANLAATVELPDGYAEAISNALSIRLVSMFGMAISSDVAVMCSQLAKQAEDTIAELNIQTRALMMPPAPVAMNGAK